MHGDWVGIDTGHDGSGWRGPSGVMMKDWVDTEPLPLSVSNIALLSLCLMVSLDLTRQVEGEMDVSLPSSNRGMISTSSYTVCPDCSITLIYVLLLD